MAAKRNPFCGAPKSALRILQVGMDAGSKSIVEFFLSKYWRKTDYVIHGVGGIDEAMEIMENTRIDLVITAHIAVKGGTGLDLLMKLRKDKRFEEIPMIFHTSTLFEDLFTDGPRPDRDRIWHIPKPSNAVLIVSTIEAVLARYGIKVPERIGTSDR